MGSNKEKGKDSSIYVELNVDEEKGGGRGGGGRNECDAKTTTRVARR